MTAVPGYYPDDDPPNPLQNPDQDPHPHVQKLADATTEFSKRDDVDATKLGLIGYSLGAAVAMRYMAANPKKVTVFADFFGLIDPTIRAGTGTFPPTIIFHTDGDRPVPISHSRTLRDDLAAKPIEHHLQEYPPEPGQFLNHPFIPGGYADGDSQKRLIEWFAKYLPPEKS